MALGTVAEKRDCNLKIIPVGMNYFHAHKFRSRAVIEFGNALDVPMDLVDKFVAGERREAIGTMLELVREALTTVTVLAPDYETLMVCPLYIKREFGTNLNSIVDSSRASPLQSKGKETSVAASSGA